MTSISLKYSCPTALVFYYHDLMLPYQASKCFNIIHTVYHVQKVWYTNVVFSC